MEATSVFSTISPAITVPVLYPSFESYIRGFNHIDRANQETYKVNLVIAPTGSGKTTVFIAELVRKYPNTLFVLCLPRVLACNVAIYLRSQYKLHVVVRNGKLKEDIVENTQVLIMTYRSAVNAVCSGNIHKYMNFSQKQNISFVFDECHETCVEARLLYYLFMFLFIITHTWLHSLFCVSATMDPAELSKRLGIEQRFIRTSLIQAPLKQFVCGSININSIQITPELVSDPDPDPDPDPESDPVPEPKPRQLWMK